MVYIFVLSKACAKVIRRLVPVQMKHRGLHPQDDSGCKGTSYEKAC